MQTVSATELKNRLGRLLDTAAWTPVAVERHGKVVAYLVPAGEPPRTHARVKAPSWGRAAEELVVALCARGDFRPSRWKRAGDRRFLAGVATLLASLPEFDRPRMLALAQSLAPGMGTAEAMSRWLDEVPLDPARFVPMLRSRLAHGRRP